MRVLARPDLQEADPEQSLVERAKELSPEAWTEIYDRYFPRMYIYAFHRVGNSHEAEDIAAQVFLEAVKGIRSFRYRGVRLSSWLYAITRNLCASYLRHQRRNGTAPVRVDSLEVAGPSEIEAAEARNDLHRALRQLTRKQQEVLALRFSGWIRNA